MGKIDCSEKGNYLVSNGYKEVSLFRLFKKESKTFWFGIVGRLDLFVGLQMKGAHGGVHTWR